MELGYNKNLRLYLRTQYNPNTGIKLGKGKKKNLRAYTEVGTFTTITLGKKILINQFMLSKILSLAYVEKPPTDIIQNIRKDILDFLWNYRKVNSKPK